MNFKTIGLITYHHNHLKTDQMLQRLLPQGFNFKLYALVFKPRPSRQPLFSHRPNQSDAIHPESLAKKHKIPYKICEKDIDIDNSCDLYLVMGAGILSPECVAGKKIINGHPGIIPATRGLDAFKWALLDMKPLGVSLHYIDKEVDAGEVISVIPTHVYNTDTFDTLARRHYENELNCMARFQFYLEHPENSFADIPVGEPRMRMPREKEEELKKMFPQYIEKYGQ